MVGRPSCPAPLGAGFGGAFCCSSRFLACAVSSGKGPSTIQCNFL